VTDGVNEPHQGEVDTVVRAVRRIAGMHHDIGESDGVSADEQSRDRASLHAIDVVRGGEDPVRGDQHRRGGGLVRVIDADQRKDRPNRG
jgi:hypothetical protein